ncbi:hypothetical protein [Chromohalobacter sp. 11-W]|uniref:hypothetical protein n=1 Tax=Chromohalobacter sp. 11-W TaxID=2994061 RepID=UPI0024699C01|nr:hypothetical protein [Chromohalobacter sp. 11-W]
MRQPRQRMMSGHRLFFAAWPDDALRERLASLASRLQRHCGGVRRLSTTCT